MRMITGCIQCPALCCVVLHSDEDDYRLYSVSCIVLCYTQMRMITGCIQYPALCCVVLHSDEDDYRLYSVSCIVLCCATLR